MNYIKTNKEAWEEAFDNRSDTWCNDIIERLQTEKLPYIEKALANELKNYSLKNKTIGHFCCNNGRELLSLMKLGAQKGIGFDLAENQVQFANDLAKKMNINCNFIATDILNIGSEYENIFDFIVITIGTLCWFHDLNHFFNKIHKCLRKGGKVIINEAHPVTNMLGAPGEIGYDESRPNILIHSYFNKTWTENNGMRYITGKVYNSKTFTSFSHSLSFILNAMVNAGLSIRRMQEYDYDISDGTFSILNNKEIPLSYTLIAVK